MTTRNQGYQYVFLKHIIVLVTTTHKNHITYFKCLVTVDTFNLVYTLMTAAIQGYQNVLLKHIYTTVATTHKNHITYFKCLVTADTFQ